MSELEEKLGSILSNPQMMQQIMSMAQAMGQSSGPQPDSAAQAESPVWNPEMDMSALQTLSQFAQNSHVDSDQQALLHALSPYLSDNRVKKLERAMRAAKMAGLASTLLNSGALQNLLGR